MLVTNIDKGPRGIWLADGSLKSLAPGASNDLEIAAWESEGEWFKFDAKAEKPALVTFAPVTDVTPFDAMSDDALRDAIEETTGKRPHHKTGRNKLLDMAKG